MTDDYDDFPEGMTFRPSPEMLMGPLTGIRPVDDRWGGEIPEAYMQAIHSDVTENDLPQMLERIPTDDMDFADIISMVVLQTIARTGQRLAVELDGCTIDTSTIFDDELVE